MRAFCIGMAVFSGLATLIPSKKEQEKPVPWPSILLAMCSAMWAAAAWQL